MENQEIIEIKDETLISHPILPDLQKGKLRIIPLGGFGEIGKNMLVLQTSSDLIIIDAGLMFPTEEMLGIDLVIPDISYILENKAYARAILITHAHEDHIGALPYILPKLNLPIYGTKLTLGIIKAKLREFGLSESTTYNVIDPGDKIELGDFKVEFFRMIHSISEGVGLAIHTPIGTVVHSGDFKFDQTPVDGKTANFLKLAKLGEEGILVLFSDSTYAERPGHSLSEKTVGQTLEEVFAKTKGRIIITTFASSLHRIQQIIDTAYKFNRKICYLGKSLVGNINIAKELDYLKTYSEREIKIEEIIKFKDEEIVILTTGSQGEPMSALTLMASKNHKWVAIKEGDTVIISATPVPGNETLVNNTVNLLFRLGAEVIYNISSKSEGVSDGMKIHVSGHASQEELKLLINLIRPKFFIPLHGEYRHLVHHAKLAVEMGIPKENIFKIEDGTILELDENSCRVVGKIDNGDVLVDGLGIGDIGRVVLRDRHLMAKDGVCIIVASIDRLNGEVLAGPEIISRGFIYYKESEELIRKTKEKVIEIFNYAQENKISKVTSLKSSLREVMVKFFEKEIKRRPMIIPVILEV